MLHNNRSVYKYTRKKKKKTKKQKKRKKKEDNHYNLNTLKGELIN